MANGANLSNKPPIIVVGPTGVGKTAFAVELATRLDGEILGADAFQIYRGMEILTNQPPQEVLAAVPHHLVGFLSPTETFDAARFATLGHQKISEIRLRGKLPIVVGGSGLYIKALTHGLSNLPPPNPVLRSELAELSPRQARERLAKVDPASRIDFNNPRRVLRALEISILTGKPASEWRQEWQAKPVLCFHGILLVRDRMELHARIATNVLRMFDHGVIEEVAKLPAIGSTAGMAIGLREVQSLARREISLTQCVAAITASTRRYAKRQLTWFRNQFTFDVIDLTGLRDTHEIPPRALEYLGAP